MNLNDERELRERFADLRDEDLADAPQFSRVLRLRTAFPPRRPSRWIQVAGLAAAAVVTVVVLVKTPGSPEPAIDDAIAQAEAISSWTAPTDAWLALSGLEIPDSIPSLSLSSVTLPETSEAATPQGDAR